MDGGSEPVTGLSPSHNRERSPLRRFPLSFVQQRLWLLNEMEGGDTIAYNIPIGLRLQGKVDVAILERAFSEVTRRHDVLRTTFELNPQSGAPEQLIHSWKPFHLPVAEVSGSEVAEQEQHLHCLASEESQRPFNLRTGPLMRALLLRRAADQHVLVITMHHIVSDGWSMGLLIRELATLYEAYSQGSERAPLPDLPIQYVDYANWQRKRMTSQVLDQQLGYWREQLQGTLPTLELPTHGPRPAIYSTGGKVRAWSMTRDLTEAVKSVSRREGVTLFMTLLTAFKVLLYRYTGATDLLVGTPIAGRNRREVEGLIGCFINTLVLRTDLSGEPSFRDLMGKVKEVAVGAYANQDAPFEKLVEELQPKRNLSRSPLFQVMFVLQNAPVPALRMANVLMSHQDIEAATSKFDMTFAVMEKDDGTLSGWLEYNTSLFDERMIDQMIRHYQNILQSVVANLDLPISRIRMLDEAERRQALAVSSLSACAVTTMTLHQLFEAQAAASPLAVAVVFEGATLTYAELNLRANQLAHLLRSRGVGPDHLVGISMERSVEMIIAILAILKAGAAYVPLDPAYPKDRLAFVLEDARISVLLTQQDLLDSLPPSQAEKICLDTDWQAIAPHPTGNPSPLTTADNLAYVIYTSGSTGKPKGVLVTHANVARLFEVTQPWFHFDHRDVWTLFHSFAFDFSVWEFWGALLYGGRLVIVPYLVSRSPQAFYDLLVDQQVTILNQTPSAFRQLIQVDEIADESRHLELRTVIFGGEALDLQSLRPWFARHGDERPQLVNMYGITETTVHVTYRALTTGDASEGNGSLIGQALPDLYAYVLDQQLEPVAVGVSGELYVGGAGVGRGYLNRPELTAQRFIADPYAAMPGARLYRTGDLGRRLPNGELEYLGRIDQQVKIRGFRIELGEIEATLYEQAGVKEAAIVARELGGGEKELVAYIVGDEQAPVTANELRSGLKRTLPEYMVPAAFVMLERLPLTENGKLDRNALPAPYHDRDELEQEYVGPRTEDEQTVADIFSEILRIDKLGVNDDFFELGGHSLLATQVLTRLLEKFKVEVPLRRLFETPTVAGLAEAISELQDRPVQEIDPIAKISHPVEDLLLANLDQLTDQQVEALLSDFTTPHRRKKWTADPSN